MKKKTEVENTRTKILEEGAILCIRFGERGPIEEACRAAARGGLRVLEITLTTPGALELIKNLAGEKDILVGAGTVLSPEQAQQVADAGAKFILSPVFDEAVVVEAYLLGLLAIPGAGTPTEILTAYRHGSRLIKVFPSGPLGGPEYLRIVRGPFPDLSLIPTSGPTAKNLSDYFAAGAVAVGIATAEVFPPGLKPAEVEAAARKVRKAINKVRGE